MPQVSYLEHEPDDGGAEFVEADPTGRYGRYGQVLGKGAFKKVYKAFDGIEGIEVAWNQVKVADLLSNFEDLERLYSEVHLLKTLKHKNIIKFYHSWVDTEHQHINFITEVFTSGTLRQYRQQHRHVDLRALKKWSRQILEGLSYLHSHDPPVIHRDLKCDNIFVNGNQGEVKIGDLGLAAILRKAHSAHSVIGTPEFMAPELYEEEYDELVDIYAFGMCLLELVTLEYPYIECANAAQIFKKVTSGIKPSSLAKVTDPGVKAFIEKCITHVSKRLPAKDLLMDPFLRSNNESDSLSCVSGSTRHHSDGKGHDFNICKTDGANLPNTSRDFVVQVQRKDINTIFLKLQIADSKGHLRNIYFPFDIEVDTVTSVAREMVEQLDLTDEDASVIASMIESEIQPHVHDWTPSESSGKTMGEVEMPDTCGPETIYDTSSLTNDSVLTIDRRAKDNTPSPGSGIRNEENPISDASLEELEDPSLEEESKASRFADSKFDNGNRTATYLIEGNNANSSGGKYTNFRDFKSEPVILIVEELEHMLLKQQNELNQLKRRHELAIYDVLKTIPPKILQEVLRRCELKMPENVRSSLV